MLTTDAEREEFAAHTLRIRSLPHSGLPRDIVAIVGTGPYSQVVENDEATLLGRGQGDAVSFHAVTESRNC